MNKAPNLFLPLIADLSVDSQKQTWLGESSIPLDGGGRAIKMVLIAMEYLATTQVRQDCCPLVATSRV